MSSTDPSIAEAAVGRCRGCGYALWGLASTQCPECGRAFDPADPRTMSMGRSPGRVARALLRTPGWPTFLLAFLATAAVVYATRPPVEPVAQWTWSPVDLRYYANPDLYRPGWPPRADLITTTDQVYAAGLALWLATAGWFAGRLLMAAGLRLRFRGHAGRLLPRPRAAMAALLLLLVSAACVGVGWPYRLGQHWAADYLAAYARDEAAVAAEEAKCQARHAADSSIRPTAGPAGEPTPTDSLHSIFSPILPPLGPMNGINPPVPLVLSSAREELVLRAAARWGATPRDRAAARALALDSGSRPLAERLLEDALVHERHPASLAQAIRLLAMFRRPADAERIEPFLASPDAGVRAAAADGLGILRDPAFDAEPWGHVEVPGDLPLRLPTTAYGWARDADGDGIADRGGLRGGPRQAISPAAVAAMADLLANGATVEEREAAARATLTSPPLGHALRLAEWGVWVDAAAPAAASLDIAGHVPPFVHRFGGPMPLPAGAPWSYVSVPVLHLSSAAPLAVDLSVQIRRGRATYAYPKPDDYSVSTAWRHSRDPSAPAPVGPPLPPGRGELLGSAAGRGRWAADGTVFDRPEVAAFGDRRAGFPWLEGTTLATRFVEDPGELSFDTYVRLDGLQMLDAAGTAVGFRWQSLIVTPDRRPWMTPPVVPADPRFAWWTRLRDVPCGWVSSRGESERFLYYDGPSHASPAVVARPSADGTRLTLSTATDPRATGDETGPDLAGTAGIEAVDQTARSGRRQERRGMYVAVTGGVVTAEVVPVPQAGQATPGEYVIGSGERLAGPAVEGRLREWIVDAGLSGPEADGLLAVWRTPFFGTEGRRFVTLMAAVDYDGLCPMTIRPKPTELVRVGLVWAEFGK